MHEKKYDLVSDSRDSRYLTLRSLQTQQGRSKTGCYIIEGIRHLARAVEARSAIHSIFVAPSVLSNHYGQKLARKLRRQGVPGVRLSHHLYHALSVANEPQGIGAVLRQEWVPLKGLNVPHNSLWLAIESIESPGNLGTILRTSEASGVSGIFVLVDECDPHDPAAVRASMGSLFSQQLIRCSVHEFITWAKSKDVSIVASTPVGLMNYKDLHYRWLMVLALSREKRGLSEQLLDAAHFTVRIPMHGLCDSLNIAVAAGVLLFEMSSQRRWNGSARERVV
jgi:TrmH family RNA methyltransferase